MKSSLFALSSLCGLALAAPHQDVSKKATSFCGQYDTSKDGPFTVYNNLWGEGSATSGSQCTEIESLNGNTLTWSTSWSWQGVSYDVKSFANAAYAITPAPLKSISSIPTKWDWSYTGSNIVADVAYDMFTSSSASGSAQFEIMVWLGALGGAGPISSSGSPIATPEIGGTSWKLYKGPNGAMTVYSFVANSEQTSFSGDMMNFFHYLEQNQGFSSDQYLLSVQAGTEPFTGSNAKLSSTYTISVK